MHKTMESIMNYIMFWCIVSTAIALVLSLDHVLRRLDFSNGLPAPLATVIISISLGVAVFYLHGRLSDTDIRSFWRYLLIFVHAALAIAVYAAVSLIYTLASGIDSL